MPAQLSFTENQAHLTLSGRFTYDEHEAFHNALTEMQRHEPRSVTVHLSGVEFMDSAGLGMLLLLRDRMPQTTGISLSNTQESVRKILQLTKLDSIFTLC